MQHLSNLAEIFVLGGIASALIITADLRTCRQPMRIMNIVWVLTGLWSSVIGLWAYFTFGRPAHCDIEQMTGKRSAPKKQKQHSEMEISGDTPAPKKGTGKDKTDMSGMDETEMAEMPDMPGMKAMNMGGAGKTKSMDMSGGKGMDMSMNMPKMKGMAGMEMSMQMPKRPMWESVVLSTLHCGAGCTLADLVGEWAMYFIPVAIGGSLLAGTWVVDYLLALIFGIGFQYAAIREMQRTLPRGTAIAKAAKADFLSLTAWQVGMYGWMAIAIFVLNDGEALHRNSFLFWYMMQIAMACGFLVALPVNYLLIRMGIKKGM